jgi:uncharacterized membrane protein
MNKIIEAIRKAEALTSAEIRVHVSQRWFERHPMKRAQHLFHQYGLDQSPEQNAVLVYVNLRRRKFAIFHGKNTDSVQSGFGRGFWERIAREMKRNFIATHPENAIAMTVVSLGEALSKIYPANSTSHHSPESEYSED